MKRSPLKRNKRLKMMSDRRRQAIQARKAALGDPAEHDCIAGKLIYDATGGQHGHLRARKASDWHELVRRSQGGSISDPDNVVSLCRLCHDFCHNNPALAVELGLLKMKGKE